MGKVLTSLGGGDPSGRCLVGLKMGRKSGFSIVSPIVAMVDVDNFVMIKCTVTQSVCTQYFRRTKEKGMGSVRGQGSGYMGSFTGNLEKISRTK